MAIRMGNTICQKKLGFRWDFIIYQQPHSTPGKQEEWNKSYPHQHILRKILDTKPQKVPPSE